MFFIFKLIRPQVCLSALLCSSLGLIYIHFFPSGDKVMVATTVGNQQDLAKTQIAQEQRRDTDTTKTTTPPLDRNPFWPFTEPAWSTRKSSIGRPIQDTLALAVQKQHAIDSEEFPRLQKSWKGCSDDESKLLMHQVAHFRGSIEDYTDKWRRLVKFQYPRAVNGTFHKCISDVAARVAIGRARAKELNIVVGAIVMDGGAALPTMFRSIANLVSRFKDHRIVFVENDSHDDSKERLNNWQREDPERRRVSISDLGFHQVLGREGFDAKRLSRMARVRNHLRYMIKTIGLSHGGTPFEPNLVIIMDTDMGEVCSDPLEIDMVYNAIGRPEFLDGRADMMCAQEVGRFWGQLGVRGTFATRFERHKEMSGKSRPAGADPLRDEGDGHVLDNQIFYGDALMPLISCFGGLALYNPVAFHVCEYDESGVDSEHVGFHQCMIEKGMRNPYLDPYMVTRSDNVFEANPAKRCVMCPSVDIVLNTWHNAVGNSPRFDAWDRTPKPGEKDICKFQECLDTTTYGGKNKIPCTPAGMYSSSCICVDLVAGKPEHEQCECEE